MSIRHSSPLASLDNFRNTEPIRLPFWRVRQRLFHWERWTDLIVPEHIHLAEDRRGRRDALRVVLIQCLHVRQNLTELLGKSLLLSIGDIQSGQVSYFF